MRTKLISTLKRIVILADFKTIQTKFINMGVDPEVVKTYLTDFKSLRDQQKIKDVEKKDIDFWGKKSWDDFKSFVDTTKSTKSKSEEKKLEKLEGAELVAENSGWKLYKIFNHKAARLYGSGTQWCITEEDGVRWREYRKHSSFYFLISKKLPKDDPFYKIAVQHSYGKNTYWDATDKNHDNLPEALEVPTYKYEHFETTDTAALKKKIKEFGLTSEISDEIQDIFGHQPIKYFSEKEFLAFEDFKDLAEFALTDNTLNWNVNILNGNTFLDDAQAYIDHNIIEDILDKLKEKHLDLYDKLLTKLLDDSDFKEYMEENYIFEEGTTVETLKKNKDLNRRLSHFIIDQNDDLRLAFTGAADDACRSATEHDLWEQLDNNIKKCAYLLLDGDYLLDSKVYMGVPVSELGQMGDDIVDDISKEIDIGIDRIEYIEPTETDVLTHLVEYQLTEYLH